MSSSDEENIGRHEVIHEDGDRPKKRPRACDSCRRKKVRCNGPEHSSRECTNCINSKVQCTYVEKSKRRVPTKEYVASLEDRITNLHDILRRFCPDDKIYHQWIRSLTEDNASLRSNPISPSHLVQGSTPQSDLGTNLLPMWAQAIRSADDVFPLPHLDDENDSPPVIASSLDTNRFFGKSSAEMLICEAVSTKKQLVGDEDSHWILGNRREEFWALRPWESRFEAVAPRCYIFPEPDLASDLIDLFFEHVNLHLPLLHRPSFQRSIRNSLHYGDEEFAAVFLLVCSIGSRFSNDPRVCVDGVDSYNSAGWKWFDQVEIGKTSFPPLPSLYHLQLYCLTIEFLLSSSAPQSVWTTVGIALRLAQDVGAHIRRTTTPTAEGELWKRAFWVLICMDRVVSVSIGRPCAIQDEDFDLDLPIECDDEYWEHPDPEQRFRQPPNKPCTMTAFILHLRLIRVLNCCIQGVYSLNKTNEHFGIVGHRRKSRIVKELDSSLNKWLESVPEYLIWDPNRDNIKLFRLSAVLHASYHHVQILIHRPFISSPSKSSPFPFPSLSICTNSARACISIADALHRRNRFSQPPPLQAAVFTSALMLLLKSWIGNRSGSSPEQNADDKMSVLNSLEVLKASEERWHQAGRFRDILTGLLVMGEHPLPHHGEQPAADMREKSTSRRSLPLPQGNKIDLLQALSQLYTVPPDEERSTASTSNEDTTASPVLHPRPGPETRAVQLQKLSLDNSSSPSFDDHPLAPSQQPQAERSCLAHSEISRPLPQASIVAQGPAAGVFPVERRCSPFETSLDTLCSSSLYNLNPTEDFMAFQSGNYPPTTDDPGSVEDQQLEGAYSYRDPMATWSNVPTGFGLDDWDMYLTAVNESSREHGSCRHAPSS